MEGREEGGREGGGREGGSYKYRTVHTPKTSYIIYTTSQTHTHPHTHIMHVHTDLRGQYDQETTEDVDKVEKEIERVSDVVSVSVVVALHNQLSVEQHKPTEQYETTIHLQLMERVRD